jgi:hypothetical protein
VERVREDPWRYVTSSLVVVFVGLVAFAFAQLIERPTVGYKVQTNIFLTQGRAPGTTECIAVLSRWGGEDKHAGETSVNGIGMNVPTDQVEARGVCDRAIDANEREALILGSLAVLVLGAALLSERCRRRAAIVTTPDIAVAENV